MSNETTTLKSSFRGELIEQRDASYDTARKVYNGMIDRRPRLIARCGDVAYVIAAVNFGREALANAGASVMIGDILVALGRETAGRLAKTGAKTGFVELNVTDDRQWEKAVAATIATLGGYDILINNAGIEITSLVVDLEAEDLRRMCDVNIVSA